MKVSVPPTLLISSIGVHPDAAKAVSMDVKIAGDLVYVIGGTKEELGGSEYFALLGSAGNAVPVLDAAAAKERYARLAGAIAHELVASAFPVSHGGLAVALAKVAIPGRLGMDLTVPVPDSMRPDYFLFSESLSRFVVTVAPDHKRAFEQALGPDAVLLGKAADRLRISARTLLLDTGIAELEKAYKAPFGGTEMAAVRRNVKRPVAAAKAPAAQEPIPEKALIMSGYGINSEMETQGALARAGMGSDIVHINDLIAGEKSMADYRLLVFPGGFSYGDDTGTGNAYANRIRNNLWDELQEFMDGDNLVLGICNGFQILANLGLVPAFDRTYARDIALMPNRGGRLECRFVTLKPANENLWTKGIERVFCPVSHGEGNFSCSKETLKKIKDKRMVAFTYLPGGPEPGGRRVPVQPERLGGGHRRHHVRERPGARPDATSRAGDGACEPL